MSLRRATAVMTFGTVLSRLTGVLRLAAIAAALGATRLADTYNLANTAPNIIYELVLGGVLTSVFVPVFVELLEKEGHEEAWRVGSAILNIAIVLLSAIALLGIVAAPFIASIYSSRVAGPEAATQHRVLTELLRFFIPQIVFYGIAAITSGLLNAHKRFAAPMYTPVLNNLAVTAVFIAFAIAYNATDLTTVTTGQILVMGIGTTTGVALMALAQLPFLRGLGRYQMTLSALHPSVRKLGRLSLFVVGYVVVNQIGYLIVQYLAVRQPGGYTAYTYAFIFFQLPHGLFAVSIITALLPGMSAEAVNERWDTFRARLSTGIRATMMLILPASVGYIILAEPIVRLLLEHGVFGNASTTLVSSVLQTFAIGLVPFSIFQLLLRAYYSLHDTKTPFLVNCVAVAVNIAINFPLFALLRTEGLTLGFDAAYVVGASALAFLLARRIGGLETSTLLAGAGRIAVATAGMALVVGGCAWLLDAYSPTDAVGLALIRVLAPVAAGAVAYVGLASALRVPELEVVRSTVSRRLRPGSNPPG